MLRPEEVGVEENHELKQNIYTAASPRIQTGTAPLPRVYEGDADMYTPGRTLVRGYS